MVMFKMMSGLPKFDHTFIQLITFPAYNKLVSVQCCSKLSICWQDRKLSHTHPQIFELNGSDYSDKYKLFHKGVNETKQI